MSDFRKFCIAYFVTAGLLSAGDNHHWWAPVRDGAAGIMLCATTVGAVIVMWLGKRGEA